MVAKGRFDYMAIKLVDLHTMTHILVAVTGFAGNGGCANKRLCSFVVLMPCGLDGARCSRNDLLGWARSHTRC